MSRRAALTAALVLGALLAPTPAAQAHGEPLARYIIIGAGTNGVPFSTVTFDPARHDDAYSVRLHWQFTRDTSVKVVGLPDPEVRTEDPAYLWLKFSNSSTRLRADQVLRDGHNLYIPWDATVTFWADEGAGKVEIQIDRMPSWGPND